MIKLPRTDKIWGYELEVVNTPEYCGKILHLNKGYQCSLHYHKDKDETFLVNDGKVSIEVGDKILIMESGDTCRIMPGTKHRFSGLEDSEIIEFSTHHEDGDSYRDEPSRRIPGTQSLLPNPFEKDGKWYWFDEAGYQLGPYDTKEDASNNMPE